MSKSSQSYICASLSSIEKIWLRTFSEMIGNRGGGGGGGGWSG